MEILCSMSQSFPEIRKNPSAAQISLSCGKGILFSSDQNRNALFSGSPFFSSGGAYSYRSMTLLMFAVQDFVFAAMAEAYSKFPRAHWEIT